MKHIILFTLLLLFLAACDKDPIPQLAAPAITTGNASNVAYTTATVTMSITDVSKTKEIGVLYSTSSSSLTPANAQRGSIENFATGDNTVTLAGLSAGTTHYYKAYATNGIDYVYGDMKTFITGGVQDIEGNVYNTVTIGTQVWMAENLKTTKYRNGTSILNVTNSTSWSNLTSGAWCNNENYVDNGVYYGKLYNWYAVVDIRNIAPIGWHVPTDAEWTKLENYLITNRYNYDGTPSGNKIAKALAAKTDWENDTNEGTIGNDLTKNNKTGFSALPGGYRDCNDGSFWNLNFAGHWWSTTQYDELNILIRSLYDSRSDLTSEPAGKQSGISVRCIRDY